MYMLLYEYEMIMCTMCEIDWNGLHLPVALNVHEI